MDKKAKHAGPAIRDRLESLPPEAIEKLAKYMKMRRESFEKDMYNDGYVGICALDQVPEDEVTRLRSLTGLTYTFFVIFDEIGRPAALWCEENRFWTML